VKEGDGKSQRLGYEGEGGKKQKGKQVQKDI
jgi:hypothetical protein